MIKEINIKESPYGDQYVALLDYCFRNWGREDLIKEWEVLCQQYPECKVLGYIENDSLASVVTFSNREIYVDGNKVKMYGVGGVATKSTHRSGGICTEVFKVCLEKMYQEQVPFAMLAPFSYSFYEKLGWSWCYDYNTYDIKIEAFKNIRGTYKLDLIEGDHLSQLAAYYEKQIKNYNGTTRRSVKDWESKIAPDKGRYGVMCKNEKNDVAGYMLYEISDQFKVVEIEYTNKNALESLLGFISRHSAQVTCSSIKTASHVELRDVLSNPKCRAEKVAYMMGRIVWLEGALACYNYSNDGSCVIQINDDLLKQNTGTYKLTIENGRMVKIERTNEQHQIGLDIKALTKLILGFRTIDQLSELEQVQVFEKESLAFFKKKPSKVVLYDFF